MWISKKEWKQMEKRVADFEENMIRAQPPDRELSQLTKQELQHLSDMTVESLCESLDETVQKAIELAFHIPAE